MRWPDPSRPPLSRLRMRTMAVVVVLDDVTHLPPASAPVMHMQQLGENGAPVELDWTQTVTLGGAVVFSGHTVDGPGADERYRLVVEPDGALRPEQPDGYEFTVRTDPRAWPVRVDVNLLSGPAYKFPPRLPVVHGLVVQAGPGPDRPPVADATVAASEDRVTVTARCAADHLGSFSLGLPTYRPSRPTSIRATAPDGTVGAWHALTADDFVRSVQLTV